MAVCDWVIRKAAGHLRRDRLAALLSVFPVKQVSKVVCRDAVLFCDPGGKVSELVCTLEYS